jgi:hypothetical protein
MYSKPSDALNYSVLSPQESGEQAEEGPAVPVFIKAHGTVGFIPSQPTVAVRE